MAATGQRDYYEVLGIARDANDKAIKNAFRDLALKYHPDRNKEPGAEARFKEIAEAYAVLSDPQKRAAYDSGGMSGIAGFTPADLFAGINFEEIFGGQGFDFGGGFFDRFFHRAGPASGQDLTVPLVISLEQVAAGGEEKVRVARMEPCPDCNGSGARTGTKPRTCPACSGTGRKTESQQKGNVLVQRITPCPQCGGRGQFIDTPCPRCTGRGEIEREDVVTVKVPAGIEDGMALRVPGRGLRSTDPQGKAGDLLIVVHDKPDARFERDGADLWRIESIDIPDAVLGTSREVPTLDGQAKVKVPPGTQSDAVLRLTGKGLPRFGRRGRGDLFVRVRIRVPDHLSDEEQRLYERLKSLSREHP